MSHELRKKTNLQLRSKRTEKTGYLIDTLLDEGFIGFAACSHELCALVLNGIELLLQPINLLFKSLQTQQRIQV